MSTPAGDIDIEADYDAQRERFARYERDPVDYVLALSFAIDDEDERDVFRKQGIQIIKNANGDQGLIFDSWYGFHYRENVAPIRFDSDLKSLRQRFRHLEHDPDKWIMALSYHILGVIGRETFAELAKEMLQYAHDEDDVVGEILEGWRDNFAYFPLFTHAGEKFTSGYAMGETGKPSRLTYQRAAGAEKDAKSKCVNIRDHLLPAFSRLDLQDICYSTAVARDIDFGDRETEEDDGKGGKKKKKPDPIDVPAEGIMTEGNWQQCTAPVVLIRIGKPGHILTAAYIRKTHRLEVFDAGGDVEEAAYMGKVVAQIITLHEGHKQVPRVIIVNTRNIQELEQKGYCQTWIFWYAYMRFARSNPWTAKQVARYLKESTLEDLKEDIRNFYNALISL